MPCKPIADSLLTVSILAKRISTSCFYAERFALRVASPLGASRRRANDFVERSFGPKSRQLD